VEQWETDTVASQGPTPHPADMLHPQAWTRAANEELYYLALARLHTRSNPWLLHDATSADPCSPTSCSQGHTPSQREMAHATRPRLHDGPCNDLRACHHRAKTGPRFKEAMHQGPISNTSALILFLLFQLCHPWFQIANNKVSHHRACVLAFFKTFFNGSLVSTLGPNAYAWITSPSGS
jgi:hypothetical protein